jgi:hypothetical protein
MVDPRVRTAFELLFGYERGRGGAYIAYAAILAALAFVVTAAVWAGLAVFGFERFRGVGRPLLLGVCALAALLAGLHGYANDGVVIGAAVAMAPLAGLLAWGSVAVGLELPTPAAGQGGFDRIAVLGLAVGIALTLVGTGVGRLVSSDPARNVREETPIDAD